MKLKKHVSINAAGVRLRKAENVDCEKTKTLSKETTKRENEDI